MDHPCGGVLYQAESDVRGYQQNRGDTSPLSRWLGAPLKPEV